jgi:hypothetical protein
MKVKTMTRITSLFALSLLTFSVARGAEPNPFHNFDNPYDVDGNGVVDLADVNSVIDLLLAKEANPLIALDEAPARFWDTSNNGRPGANDALGVINYLLTVPEPGSIVTAAAGLLALTGFCFRKKRRTTTAVPGRTTAEQHD